MRQACNYRLLSGEPHGDDGAQEIAVVARQLLIGELHRRGL
jgi:hypothetical protein